MARLSVAMCTYNGQRFLQAQLDSIAAQIRPPDELVVCDDESTDETVPILQAFARKAPFRVLVHVNEKNVGYVRNYDQAIRRCTGDWIALADQDDIWRPGKLQRLSLSLKESPRVGLAFSDAELVDETAMPLLHRLWQAKAVSFSAEPQERFRRGSAIEVLLHRSVVTGATLMFRSDFRPLILPLADNWVHDGWIAILVSLCADLDPIPDLLIQYRQHSDQQLGASRKEVMLWPPRMRKALRRLPDAYLRHSNTYGAVLERIRERKPEGIRPDAVARLEGAVSFWRMRAELTWNRFKRFRPVIRELRAGSYSRYSNGSLSVLKDLFL